MAYLRDIEKQCDYTPACRSRAVVELINRFNEVRGRFCRRHGKKRLEEQKKAEKDVS